MSGAAGWLAARLRPGSSVGIGIGTLAILLGLVGASRGRSGLRDVAPRPVPVLASHPGFVARNAGVDVDACVADPIAAMQALTSDPPYVLGYRSGRSSCGIAAGTNRTGEYVHRQGIQRLRGAGGDHLLVSYSVQRNNRTQTRAGFEVVRMGGDHGEDSLGPASGVTTTSAPACGDRIVANPQVGPALDHAGGMDLSGSYLAVALEDSDDEVPAGFRVADLSNPATPTGFEHTIPRARGTDAERKNAGGVAMTKLSDGSFYALVFGRDAGEYEAFRTTSPRMCLSGPCWRSEAQGPTRFGHDYQNLQFITGCGGELFLLGTHRDDGGNDMADLWRVTLAPGTFTPSFGAAPVSRFHAMCSSEHTGGTRYCNFDAGAGAYVDAVGQLYVYGVEHYDDAYPDDGKGVKVREFLPRGAPPGVRSARLAP